MNLNEAFMKGFDAGASSTSWPLAGQGFPRVQAPHHHPPVHGTEPSRTRPQAPRSGRGRTPYKPGWQTVAVQHRQRKGSTGEGSHGSRATSQQCRGLGEASLHGPGRAQQGADPEARSCPTPSTYWRPRRRPPAPLHADRGARRHQSHHQPRRGEEHLAPPETAAMPDLGRRRPGHATMQPPRRR